MMKIQKILLLKAMKVIKKPKFYEDDDVSHVKKLKTGGKIPLL